MKAVRGKNKKIEMQCSLCAAEFEIWMNNSRINEEKKERMSQHLLQYCPACSRAESK
jgi:hypothetical protein